MEHLVEVTGAEDIHRVVRDALVSRRVKPCSFCCSDVIKYVTAMGIEYEMFSHAEAFDDIPCVDVEWFADEMFAMESRNARILGEAFYRMHAREAEKDDIYV